MKPKDELRKMLELTLSKVCDDLKKGSVLAAETDEKAARYLLSEIEKNLEGPIGLPKSGPPKPWCRNERFGEVERDSSVMS